MLSLLPGEVRKMIWKHLSPHLHIGRSLPKKPNHHSLYQRILLTSRRIYAEVAAVVPSGYNGETMNISVHPEYQYKSWIRVRTTKRAEKGIQWKLEDLPDAISRGFGDLPWHSLNVTIYIWAPDRKDSGQIICLYQIVRALVEMLKGANGFLSLNVVFGQRKKARWFNDGLPQCSIENNADLLQLIVGAKRDYAFIVPLFLQIRNAKMAKMYFTETFEGKRGTFIDAPSIMTGTIHGYAAEPRIQKHLDLLFTRVEHILDLLPSKTADMLRLDRFSSWYTDRLNGNSPYENELERVLLDDVQRLRHDTLDRMDDRYRIMRTHNPLSLAYRSAFPGTFDLSKYPDIHHRGWNRDAWHDVYRHGIPPLNHEKTNVRYRKWRMEDDTPRYSKKFVKLHRYFSSRVARNPALRACDRLMIIEERNDFSCDYECSYKSITIPTSLLDPKYKSQPRPLYQNPLHYI